MAETKIIETVLLAELVKQGIVASNTELWHDYALRSRGKGYSPYARFYRDTTSDKRFAVVSGLPGCDAYGQAHELAWQDNNGVIENGNNIFHSVIEAGTVRLIALSDQPPAEGFGGGSTGSKNNDEVNFHPQLFVSGAEILPLSDLPILLETDPVNSNYHSNVLEWDYGICRRWLRLIEGRFLGSWIFLANPGGDVLIKYNQAGKLRLRLQYAQGDDSEFIPKAFFDAARVYPVTISDSATFYPDANPESSSVDGVVYQEIWAGDSWANIRDGAGNGANDTLTYSYGALIGSDDETGKWRDLWRSIFLFDTSGLPDEAIISAATLSLYGCGKEDGGGWTPDINVYSSAPASNTGLAAGDFDSLGSTGFSDAISYASWSAAYNAFSLNASGIAAISRTGVSRFGTRNANYDVANIAPTWVANKFGDVFTYYSEQGTGYQPGLVVTYTEGTTAKSATETGSGTDALTSGSPVVVTSDTETGSGLESLENRSLGQTEAGSGLESLGSRELGRNETGLGLDIASLLAAFMGVEAGSALEAALKAAAFTSGDAGLGAELSWMLKDAQSGDSGVGRDALKSLINKVGSSSDMQLFDSQGQATKPARQVRMPSKGVNL